MMPGMSTFWEGFWTNAVVYRDELDRALAIEANDVSALSSRAHDQAHAIHELQLTVAALMQVLAELGRLDPHAVQSKVEAAVAELRPPPPKPNEAHPHKTATPVFEVRCDKCGEVVPSTRTTITARGTLCDRCAA